MYVFRTKCIYSSQYVFLYCGTFSRADICIIELVDTKREETVAQTHVRLNSGEALAFQICIVSLLHWQGALHISGTRENKYSKVCCTLSLTSIHEDIKLYYTKFHLYLPLFWRASISWSFSGNVCCG